MINFLFIICLISVILVTYWIISKIKKLNNSVNKMTLNTHVLGQKLTKELDKVKKKIAPKPKKTPKRMSKTDVFLLLSDTALTLIYKRKYDKIKDYYEFIKNTLA